MARGSARRGLALACWATVLLGSGLPAAGQEFDNPKTGNAPCIVLSRYQVEEGRSSEGQPEHRASAALRNICGRSVEITFCFAYREPVNGVDRSCFGGLVRPWSDSQVQTPTGPVMITGFEQQWRYAP